MTDLEISKALALAIGWERVATVAVGVIVQTSNRDDRVKCGAQWLTHCRRFDYRDPAVIWPIAERYDCFPLRPFGKCGESKWLSVTYGFAGQGDTAAKAVALAVISIHAPK